MSQVAHRGVGRYKRRASLLIPRRTSSVYWISRKVIWTAVISQLKDDALHGLAIVAGGRSAGARVACRTAADVGAAAVLCLAFPVHPPGRGDDPAKSRLSELDAVTVPTLVVQGESDPFGMPPDGPNRTVVRVPGNHSLRSGAAVAAAVSDWLEKLEAA